jgi:ubiquinone/menaquinone biosynthesis C-methylase UbiE
MALEASEYLPAQVEEAKKINSGIRIVTEDVYSLDRSNSDVDMICLLQVLEHLKYPVEALKELRRVTKKYLIIGVPREPIGRIMNVLRFKYLASFGNTTGHVNHWSSKGIQRLIEKHFGTVVAVENPLPWTLIIARKD